MSDLLAIAQQAKERARQISWRTWPPPRQELSEEVVTELHDTLLALADGIEAVTRGSRLLAIAREAAETALSASEAECDNANQAMNHALAAAEAAEARLAEVERERDGARTDIERCQEVLATSAKELIDMRAKCDALREQLAQADAVIDAYATEMFGEDRPFPDSPDSPTHIANALARHNARKRDAARKRVEEDANE